MRTSNRARIASALLALIAASCQPEASHQSSDPSNEHTEPPVEEFDSGVAVSSNALITGNLTPAPIADTVLRSGAPFGNDGLGQVLGVTSASVADVKRSIVRFNEAQIKAAFPAGRVLQSARLDVVVTGISAGWLGGAIDIHAMNREWVEGTGLFGNGASWVCANDTNTTLLGNLTNNCTAANNWSMTTPAPFARPFNTTATDRVPVFTGGLTTISFDVTEDIRAVRNGGKHFGWMLAAAPNLVGGLWVNFGSRETLTAKPKLTINFGTDDCPSDPNKGLVGACGCGNPDLDTNFDNVADCFDAGVPATGDTALRLALPFQNDGTGLFLPTTAASIVDIERSLVKVSNAAIDAARNGRPINKAYLELTVAGIAVGWAGGQIAIHRMNATPQWVEGTGLAGFGATWSCANDFNTTIFGPLNNCSPWDNWYMSPLQWTIFPKPYADAPTAVTGVTWPGMTSVRFDVTADVQAFLANPSSNNGWILQGQASNFLSGNWVNFGSRESGAPPRLLLELPDQCLTTGKSSPGACGCSIPDTDSDGDGTPDCVDECPQNNPQIVLSTCGCGDDLDADNDGLENCVDPCPNDNDPTLGGECGCPSTGLAVAGAACEGPCGGSGDPSGVDECDGAGHCGDIGSPSCPSPDPTCSGCTPYVVKNLSLTTEFSIYWHCPCPRTGDFAEDKCNDLPGHHLVKIESGEQNAFIRGLIDSETWIGGNDRDVEGQWRWEWSEGSDGSQFWSGGSSGSTVGAAYHNWQSSEPGGGAGEDCASMSFTSVAGDWQDRSCGQPLDFICERSVETPGDVGEGIPETDRTCAARGSNCGPFPTQCIDASQMPGAGFTDEQQVDQLEACDACTATHADCQTAGAEPTPQEQQDCRDACAGSCLNAAEPPDPLTSVPCTDLDAYTLAPTIFADPPPEKHCAIEIATPTASGLTECESHADCAGMPAGQRHCGEVFHCRECDPTSAACIQCGGPLDPAQNPPGTAPQCTPRFEGGFDQNRCVADKYCGTPVPECFLNDNNTVYCAEYNLCEDPANVYTPAEPPGDLDALEIPEFFGEDNFTVPPIPAPDPFFPEDSACGGGANCAGPTNPSHPWCHYDVTEGLTDQNPPSETKPVTTGSGSTLSFDVNPSLSLVYETEVGPLGMPLPLLAAEASFLAEADIRVFGIPDHFTLIDLAAGARGGIHRDADVNREVCGFKAYARAEILGMDILPEDVNFNYPEVADQTECLEAVDDFQTVVDSARKAFADAREIVRQYKAFKAQNPPQFFSDGSNGLQSLCEQIAKSPPRGFPIWGPCATERPIDTINRFIFFYNEVVIGNVRTAADELAMRLDALVDAQDLNVRYPIFDPVHEDEQITLFNTTFLIGPVPANLEVLLNVQYGYGAELLAEMRIGALVGNLVASRPLDNHPVFKVGMYGGPSAGVGLTLFAGVGFDFGFASAKLGIEGGIDLGHVTVPVNAWTGIGVSTKPDLRAPPTSWADTVDVTSGHLIPTQRMAFDLMWGYGADLTLKHVLSGDLALALKIKFFFFSKKWRKTIVRFTGLCATDGSRQKWCDIELFKAGGKSRLPWGEIQLPMPFYPIKYIDWWTVDPIGTKGFETNKVGKLFYDSLCQCIAPWNSTDPPEEDCFRREDCCGHEQNASLVCYRNPTPVGGVIRSQCTGCRNPTQNCNVDTDCCNPSANSCYRADPNAAAGVCRPRSGSCGSCMRDADCNATTSNGLKLFCSGGHRCVVDSDSCVLF